MNVEYDHNDNNSASLIQKIMKFLMSSLIFLFLLTLLVVPDDVNPSLLVGKTN